MKIFKQKIRQALNDQVLQAALDANAERRNAARLTALASLPINYEEAQEQAYKIRKNVIDNLEKYLELFIQNAKANGLIVHTAENAIQAREIILGIAKNNNAKLIAKSKSMVSEEILLNQCLEDSGIQTVETDLGEYIIQLRGEHPSHIITPAVHLLRNQVGETFQKKLGIPYTTDIPILTQAARKTLRKIFLDADIGISGVNFGVAESGTLCIITNEGNGRMVTTMPKIHVALMGIERIVPTLEDLVKMLDLLPRSATGQETTVYTQFIHSPRCSNDIDGPLERHLILVDNGRRNTNKSPIQDVLLCIRCGACINACPVFREIGGHAYIGEKGEFTPYPGPIGSVISPALFGESKFGHLAQVCSLCGACKEACPINIDLPNLLLRVRAGGKEIHSKKQNFQPRGLTAPLIYSLRIFSFIMQHPKLLLVLQKTLGLFSTIFSLGKPWITLPPFSGWGYSKDIPTPVKHPFREQWVKKAISFKEPPGNFKPSHALMDQQKSLHGGSKRKSLSVKNRTILIHKFEREFTTLDGKFYICSKDTLADKVIELLKSLKTEQIISWNVRGKFEKIIDSLIENNIAINLCMPSNAKVGLTGVTAAVAETGSIMLTSGEGKPLSASLLPETHIAILYAEDIYPRLENVLTLPEVKNASASVLISGPSRTADIEMTLTIGVHGPREVIVICAT